ncbi:MAG: long-chain fatty acid--CoA ligase [Trueperaceae bacterium]
MTDVMRQEAPALVAEDSTFRAYRAPEGSGELGLGRTLVSLLDEAVERNPNPRAFNQLRNGQWQSMSTVEFRSKSELMGLGLADTGMSKGDRIAFFALNDISFSLPDMACLLAGLVTVPIYLTHAPANIGHILRESEVRSVIVTNEELLRQVAPQLAGTSVTMAVVMEGEVSTEAVPAGVECLEAEELMRRGREISALDREAAKELRAQITANDLATIIYTSGTTGVPKGVMLSHQNISSNAIGAFTGLKGYRRGPDETVLSFLPLTHIFARMLQYGCMWYGNTVYYSDADSLREHFKEVRPTLMATVPRVLERAYERIMDAGRELEGFKHRIFDWSLGLAQRYRIERTPHGMEAVQLRLADKLVLSKWRDALGGRMNYVIVGAAALRPELVNLFGAAGIQVLQGYGLTETSPVISFNRPDDNRAGTVGPPIAGVEVAVGDEGEILTRGPHVMLGYYKREDATAETIKDGWLHTGDLGTIDEDGFITLTGRIKNLFKLSTGKYVMPQPVEQQLEAEPLIEHALVVGEGEKYCAALLFLSAEALSGFASSRGLPADPAALLEHEEVQDRIRAAVVRANGELPNWSCVKRAVLALAEITIENGRLTPTLKLRREPVMEAYRPAVERLYRAKGEELDGALTGTAVVIEVGPA